MSTGTVTVAYESNSIPNLALVGQSIAQAREAVKILLNLPAQARPSVTHCNGTRLAPSQIESYRLEANDTLEFTVQQGSKGCCKGGRRGQIRS